MKKIVLSGISAVAFGALALSMEPTPAYACGGWLQPPCPKPPVVAKPVAAPALAVQRPAAPLIRPGAGNGIIAQGGGNIIAQGGGNVIAQGGGNLRR